MGKKKKPDDLETAVAKFIDKYNEPAYWQPLHGECNGKPVFVREVHELTKSLMRRLLELDNRKRML